MSHRVPDDELPDFDDMDPRLVRRELRSLAVDVREDLHDEWGETPHRERTVDVADYAFPATPDDLFPWVAVALVTDSDADRILLLRHDDHDHTWEPPGGKGQYEEPYSETARREVHEETGIQTVIDDLVLVETLQFDYGLAVTAPVTQAVFAGHVEDDDPTPESPEDAIPEVRWFTAEELPEDAQFRDQILELIG